MWVVFLLDIRFSRDYSEICIHGHIVGERTIFFIKGHFTHDGLLSFIVFNRVSMFSARLQFSKSSLPTTTCMFHVLSNLYSILPFFSSSIVLTMFVETVQALGDGINHFGHSIFAAFAKSLIIMYF